MSNRFDEQHEPQCHLLELTWGTMADAERLGCQKNTRRWAYAWIEEHIAEICIDGDVDRIVDLGGGGVRNDFADRLSRYAKETLIVDKSGDDGERKNAIHQVICDMENGLPVLPDSSVDIIVSASSLEHLAREGQRKIFREITRVLKPGGYFCGTVSYITCLTDHAIALIKADPAFRNIGSEIFGSVDIRENLMCAGATALDSVDPARFPGFADFAESALLEDTALLHDFIGSYGDIHCTREVDDLRLKWFECGFFFRKAPMAKSDGGATGNASAKEVFAWNAEGKSGGYEFTVYSRDARSGRPIIDDDLVFSYATIRDHAAIPYFFMQESGVQEKRHFRLELDFPAIENVSCQWKIQIQDDAYNTLACIHPPHRIIKLAGCRRMRVPFVIENSGVSGIRLVFCPEVRAGEGALPSRIRVEKLNFLRKT